MTYPDIKVIADESSIELWAVQGETAILVLTRGHLGIGDLPQDVLVIFQCGKSCNEAKRTKDG